MFDGGAFGPAFSTALAGTLKVFAMGLVGFWFLRRNWLSEDGVRTISQLVAMLTLPCQILHRFATRFDPAEFSDWWKYALIGAAITGFGLLLGRLISMRHNDNNEATMLVGFQNAGFFVLPMLQAILPASQFPRAALLLFVLIIPFNASLWAAGSYFLLQRGAFNPRTLLTPTFLSTICSVTLFGLFHDALHAGEHTLLWQVLFGDNTSGGSVGAIQLVGDLTVPLATIALGGSIAISMPASWKQLTYKRATMEVALVKMVFYPLLGFLVLRAFLAPVSQGGDLVVWVLLMLEFAAPPAVNTGVFATQHGYSMRYIPMACLVCYVVGLITVPFWVAVAMR